MSEHEPLCERAIERDPAHAERCPDCREQSEADRELRRLFQSAPRPGPALHFNRVLRSRLRAERERQRRRRWRLLVMQGYWVAASVACVIVLTLTRWPMQMPSPQVTCSIGGAFAIALLTPLTLLMSLGIGPLRLILETMEAFRR